jgi:predicted  nucleic acid-binding Zn-ribbon protein
MDLIQALMRLALVDEEWDVKAKQFQDARERLSNPRELVERREKQDRLAKSAAATRAQLADVELELASLQERSKQVEKDLYGGVITSSRELENLGRDSEQIKHRIAPLEDQGLALMDLADDLEAQVEAGAIELEAFERTWEQGTAAARDDYQVLRARLQELQADRERLRAGVPAREMALYDELRRTKGGHPLAPMRDGICQVCRVSVPRHKITIAEGGLNSVATCEGCGRILYQA